MTALTVEQLWEVFEGIGGIGNEADIPILARTPHGTHTFSVCSSTMDHDLGALILELEPLGEDDQKPERFVSVPESWLRQLIDTHGRHAAENSEISDGLSLLLDATMAHSPLIEKEV